MRLTSLFFTTMVLTIRPPCFFQEAGDLLIRLGGGNDRLIRRISLHVDGATELAVDLDCHVDFRIPAHGLVIDRPGETEQMPAKP